MDKMDGLEVDGLDEFSKDLSQASLLVAFYNIQDIVTENVLSLLVESTSGLSEASGDFRVEVITDIKVAVIMFLKNIDVRTLVNVCDRHHRVQQLQIFPRLLELTRTISVENLPPHVDNNYITIVFGNPQNGGEGVTNVQYFPEESSALLEFFGYKELKKLKSKKIMKELQKLHAVVKIPRNIRRPMDVQLSRRIFNSTKPKSRGQGSRKDHLSNRNVISSAQTKEGLNLVLISGDVIYHRADVIVNTVPMNLQLGGGPLSRALLQKAGPMLQKELNATRQGAEEKVGSMFMTRGCNLDCKAVLHVVAPGWDNRAGSSWQITANIIKKCLMTMEQLSFSSITFPMIGTGKLRFPKAIFAELILSEVFIFSSSEWRKTLQEVQFLVHPDDDESCQIFLDEFTRQSNRNLNKDRILMAGDTPDIFGTVSNPEFGTYEMKIGAITFQAAPGDITKEKTDVIVNSTNRTFNLKSGVSKAISEGAGPAVENKCAVLATRPHGGFIVTQGGDLMCKIIIHVPGDNDVRKTVSSVLEECEQRKYTSVSLPAIGTGKARKNPVMVANDIINSVADFAWKHSTPSLKTVKVVIFLSELLNVFRDSMRKREVSTSPTIQSIFSKAAYNIPEHWTDMNQQRYCMIQLQPGQSEYDTVKDKFSQTCLSYEIEKIERIQNVFLWQSYQLKKNHMDIKNGHTENERLLFHGTVADRVPHINQHGFNRSYAGKTAATYGNGTYFAVKAKYSAKDRYSRPDSSGRKHIYVVRVLTGLYTSGHTGIIIPPSKNPDDPTDLFDSVTNNTQHPSLFVVFSDDHAYPEYLITFRKK